MAVSSAPPFSTTSPAAKWHDDRPLRIGVSACLLGQPVRFDGGHKRDTFLCETLAPYVDWVPVCPEVEYGLSIPRETLRLESVGGEVALIERSTQKDHSAGMRSLRRVRALRAERLTAFVLKSHSPSCGLERVPVWSERSQPQFRRRRSGRGLFAEALTAAFPHLPIEEEGCLQDPAIREGFIERIFAVARLRKLMAARWMIGDLVAFHSAHKLQLMAHSQVHYRALGRLVAGAKELARGELRRRYEVGFFAALATRATRRRQVNVLQHIEGYFRDHLDSEDRAEVHGLIEDYRLARVPLVVPMALLRDHVRRHADRSGVAYLADQVYLDPYPEELLLRNHA